ncbi:MAG TPA: Na+/H+ antiporter NhaA [Acidimicrobiia bacterium]|nr:Na+/H+ antiporter NhaA [Acidimicrobiia bacterium]
MDSRRRTWATSERWVPKTFIRPFVRFSEIEASSGIALLIAAVVALIWANSGWSATYFSLLEQRLTVDFLGFHLDESVLHLINDGLMTVFFFVVGLEIKREMVHGDLRDPRSAALPVMGALGGMVVPALIYLFFNAGTAAAHGWGVPMATDIAFAVGVVALLGSRVPPGAKLFLLAVAIADDIGAIAVIALFYTADLAPGYLAAAVTGLILVWLAGRIHVRAPWFYVPMAFVIWYLTLESGVHATLAGVALAFLTPAWPFYRRHEFDERARAILDQFPTDDVTDQQAQEHADHETLLLSGIATESVSPLTRLENKLVTWSSFVVVPIFALANAGIDFRGVDLMAALGSSVALGVSLGLVLGKTVGISLASVIAVRLGLGKLPPGTTWWHIVGMAAVGGVGFTVALFVASLAFSDQATTDLAKAGIFSGSLVAGVIGSLLLRRAGPRTAR